MSEDTIFVQIASYRDPELIPTIRHCLERAKYPNRLRFGICWQHQEGEDMSEYMHDDRFKIISIPYTHSRGACWARSLVNRLYCNETYTLQIDSHMRFIPDWDEKLVEMWSNLNDKKAILTTYPPEYTPEQDESEWKDVPHIIHVYNFANYQTEQRPNPAKDLRTRNTPWRARHVAAGFIFGLGQFIKDVPYDPEFYFSGEETSLTVRLFTHGYNLYHPHKIILYHYYGRPKESKHWDDHEDWGSITSVAMSRLNCLLGRNTDHDLGEYKLGTERTLRDFMNYSGIDYERSILHLDTKDSKEPPVDLSDPVKWSYSTETFKDTLSWDASEIDTCDDPSFCAFIIKDQGDQEIYRTDVLYKDNPDIFTGKQTSIELEFEYNPPAKVPHIFMIWPYSHSQGWLANKIYNI